MVNGSLYLASQPPNGKFEIQLLFPVLDEGDSTSVGMLDPIVKRKVKAVTGAADHTSGLVSVYAALSA